jgi:hypothetical protein
MMIYDSNESVVFLIDSFVNSCCWTIQISVVKETQEINIVKRNEEVIIYHVKKINTIIDTCNDNVDVNIMMCI